jgi:hypothetical protein
VSEVGCEAERDVGVLQCRNEKESHGNDAASGRHGEQPEEGVVIHDIGEFGASVACERNKD